MTDSTGTEVAAQPGRHPASAEQTRGVTIIYDETPDQHGAYIPKDERLTRADTRAKPKKGR